MTILDYLALGLFFLCWLGYGPLLNLLAHRTGTLNDTRRRATRSPNRFEHEASSTVGDTRYRTATSPITASR